MVIVLTLLVVGILLLSQQPALMPFLPQPTGGGIYTEGLIGSFGRLNPLLDVGNSADRDIDRLIFSGLIRFDARGNPQPDLAESWGISLDGTIYNVTIRPEAVWHDGQPVTSDDVIFTLELMRSQASRYPQDMRDMWGQVQIERLDAKTVKFILPEPFAPFLDYLVFGVLPRHILGQVSAEQIPNSDFNLQPIGSGPYKFDHLIIEDNQIAGVVLTVFEDYYGPTPYIEQIVFRYYPNGGAALEAYQQGEILGIGRVTADILPDVLAEPNLSLYTGRLPRLSLVLLNLNNPEVAFFQEEDVRRALLLGLNRQWIVDRHLNGQAILADGPILPGTWAYYESIEHIAFDPDAAKALLKSAGYVIPAGGGEARVKDNQQLSFTLLHPDDVLHTAIAQSIQTDWAAIGVVVALQPVSYDQLLNEHLVPRKYQAVLVDLDLSRSPDPDQYPFWHQSEATGGQNYSQWDSRTASEYLEQARITVDPAVRMRLYRNFQVVFTTELPALPLFYPVYSYAVDIQMRGVQMAPLFDTSDRFNTIFEWYLLTRRALEATSKPTAAP